MRTLRLFGLIGFSCLGLCAVAADPDRALIQVLKSLPAERPNDYYVSNRAPLLVSPLVKLPPGSIEPRGWLRHMLQLEARGMTGRLAELSPWLRFDKSAWASKEGKGEAGWEELP